MKESGACPFKRSQCCPFSVPPPGSCPSEPLKMLLQDILVNYIYSCACLYIFVHIYIYISEDTSNMKTLAEDWFNYCLTSLTIQQSHVMSTCRADNNKVMWFLAIDKELIQSRLNEYIKLNNLINVWCKMLFWNEQ